MILRLLAAAVLVFLLTVGNIPLKFLAGPAIMAVAAMQVVPYLVDRPASAMAISSHWS